MKKSDNYNLIIILAYLHRYGIALAVIAALIFGKEYRALAIGVVFLLFSLWSFFGYVFKWKHIYCSYQNSSHEKMTPSAIRWQKMDKGDAYGVPAIFGVLGVLFIAAQFIIFAYPAWA